MKKCLAWALGLLLLAVGCAAVPEEPAAAISVQNNLAEPVYAIDVSLGADGDIRCSQATMPADGSAIPEGERMEFRFTKQDLELARLADGQTVTVSVSITTAAGDEAPQTAVGEISAALTVGQTLSLSVNGSAADGYSLHAD